MKRTLQTMAPTAAALGLAPRVKTRCFEAGGIYDADPTYTKFEPRGGLSRAAMGELFPTYELPDDVTPDGWYVGGGKETDDECRARAAAVAGELRALAADLASGGGEGEGRAECGGGGKARRRNVVLVVHYDFLCALLDALVTPERPHAGPFVNWQHFNTGITVADVHGETGNVTLRTMNSVVHFAALPSLISGF